MLKSILNSCLIYIHDLEIYKDIANIIDLVHLKIDLVNIEKWVKDNELNFNMAKCQSICFCLNLKHLIII